MAEFDLLLRGGTIVDGLRNPAQLEKREGKLPMWVRAQYADAEGRVWKELDVVQLAQHPDFLGVGT